METLTKELIEELMKLEGEARGIHFKLDADFVLEKKGKQGLRKVEEKLEKVGCPIRYKNIKTFSFYPIGLRAISLLAIEEAFGWGDKEFRELGAFFTGASLIIRVYMKFFHSIGAAAQKAPKVYGEYFTRGQLAVLDYDETEKYAIAELRGLVLHPILCRVLEGFFENIVRMIVKAKKVKCEETKCVFKGQDCCQFKITWK